MKSGHSCPVCTGYIMVLLLKRPILWCIIVLNVWLLNFLFLYLLCNSKDSSTTKKCVEGATKMWNQWMVWRSDIALSPSNHRARWMYHLALLSTTVCWIMVRRTIWFVLAKAIWIECIRALAKVPFGCRNF